MKLQLRTTMPSLCILFSCLATISYGADASSVSTEKIQPSTSGAPRDGLAASSGSDNWFNKLGVGGAVGWTHNLGRTRVSNASVVSGIVRVDAQQNDTVRPWVEAHAWFWEWGGTEDKPKWGLGPFVAVAPGANFVDAVGGGLMLGRKYRTESDSNLSFNLSIGGALELNGKVLGDGVNANQPPPPGETTARTKNTTLGSLLIMFSVGWDAFASSKSSANATSASQTKTLYKPQTNIPLASVATFETITPSEKKPMIGPQKPS